MKFMMIYLIMINILAFLMMKLDKYKARKHAWRVPEKSFFSLKYHWGKSWDMDRYVYMSS